MNLEPHLDAHADLFRHLVAGDRDSVGQHQRFYDEYLSVMDLTAEFYLQTVRTVFQEHALPDGRLMHRRQPVDCRKLRRTALMTGEGELDDLRGLGHTEAAPAPCSQPPAPHHHPLLPPGRVPSGRVKNHRP